MKKTVNVICVFLIALALITGYYTVTNSKNSVPNFNPNNMEKPDDNQNNMNDSTKDENTNSSVNEDTNANDSTKKDMNANDNSNFNPNNMEKPPTSNGLSTNNLIILGICTFVLITSLSIIVDSSSSVYKTAPMFFITNTKATINLENTTLTYGSNILLSIKGTNEWGNSGSNGGNLELNATNQKLSGDIILDSLSSVDINLKSSTLTSTVNNNKKAKEVNISIDKNSKWNVEGNSYINTLKLTNNDLNLIKDNGHNVYYDKEANEWLDGKTYNLQDGGKLIPR